MYVIYAFVQKAAALGFLFIGDQQLNVCTRRRSTPTGLIEGRISATFVVSDAQSRDTNALDRLHQANTTGAKQIRKKVYVLYGRRR